MKSFNSFEAFKLSKVQMGTVKGGIATCTLVYAGGFEVKLDSDDMSAQEAYDAVMGMYGNQIETGDIENVYCAGSAN